ncbi:MAG: VacJ family lipoprotein [Rhodobiaceae bacterium]|jgi:phospholipid-binding lipoprotein MlaA|nr:VacJ family lipoprotein [Rhodobiaceae bacterium]MBT5518588.1 VacJ family lipoprotein [Rhodobiaceae bacterium]MBT7279282.1 VacJ family lipoprotein [Rhodobiaceae bacterium]
MVKHIQKFLMASLLASSLAACASSGAVPATAGSDRDPYESFNRKMFAVEQTLDAYVLEPVAKGYLYVPQPVRRSFRNFLNNLISPVTLANDLFQGEMARASTTALRLGINTVVGIGGLFDPATRLGLERHEEDFGQTLATYGVKPGPYLYIPLLGPSPPRDLFGWGFDWLFDPVTYTGSDSLTGPIVRYTLDGVDARAANMGIIDEIERSSIDFYATVRSLYRQNRESEINNGVTNIDDLPDIDDLDDLDDF